MIYTKKPAELSIPTGNYLGEFTNELDEGDHITEFVAAGPKNYTYETFKGNQWCAATKTIKTVSQNKMYKLVFDKRVIDHDTFQSFPYGYKCSFTSHL